ncbi:hypothetical protein H123_30013 [Pseudomonas aeruginosa PA21_ST175]|nr:hypothetical protein H123_30013 [Pseudomonas aeruginosa PA21_ST175]
MARMLIADLKRTFALSNKCVGSAWVSTYRVALRGHMSAWEVGSSGTKRGDDSVTSGLDVSFGLAMGQLLYKLVCG